MSTEPVSVDKGPWIATFRDGPLAEHDHQIVFAVGPVRTDLYFFPMRGQWIRIGDEFQPPELEHPWPGQVHYRFDTIVTEAGADGEPVVYYRLLDTG